MAYDSILKALTGDAEQDLASNPWYTGGREMSAMDPTNPYEPAWKNILAKSLLSFGSGLGQGFGKRQAENQATERQTAVLSALSDTDPNAAFTKLSLESPSYNKYASLYGIEDANSKAELRKKMNDLRLTTRYNKFIDVDPSGKVMELPGAGDALASIEGKQELSRSEAKNKSDLKFKPQIEGAITGAKLREDLKYTPQIEAAKNSTVINKPLTKKELFELERKGAEEIIKSPPALTYLSVKPVIESLRKSARDPNPATSLDFTYGTVNFFDPKAAVQNGDLKLTQNLGSDVEAVLRRAVRTVYDVGYLPEDQKLNLLAVIERRNTAMRNAYEEYARPILKSYEAMGVDPKKMLIEPLSPTPAEQVRDSSKLSELSTEELKALQKELGG